MNVLWLAVVAVFGMYVAVGALLLRGIGSWLSRRWKPGVERVAYALGWLVLGLATMAFVSTRYVRAHAAKGDGPSEKAELLGRTISQQMNGAFAGLLVGVTLGALLEWRARRESAK